MATEIDWNQCVFCQENTSEDLECPAKTKRNDKGQGYVTLESIIKQFQEADALPKDIELKYFSAGVLSEHCASWHKRCRVKYSRQILKRVKNKKRKLLETLENDKEGPCRKYTRSSSKSESNNNDELCLICDKIVEHCDVYRRVAATHSLDEKVRKCAIYLGDSKLLAKLSEGDVIAIDAVYHANCLTSLYKKYDKYLQSDDKTVVTNNVHGIVLAELISYINESRNHSNIKTFKLTDLAHLYKERLLSLGVEDEHIHVTRLKNRILAQVPGLVCHTDKHSKGQGTLLIFNDDVDSMIDECITGRDYDYEALQLVKAAEIVRREMFQIKQQFIGSFTPDCQVSSVPSSLLALVEMVLHGPNIRNRKDSSTQNHTVSLAQLMLFNSVKHTKKEPKTGCSRHTADRETPLPLYVGLKIHTLTRSKELVDIMYKLGMSVSYERILQVLTDIANKVCERFEAEKTVCPMNLKHKLFTVAALDNIDHNPSATTAHDSFHGTSISVFQCPTSLNQGTERNPISLEKQHVRKVCDLPQEYTDVVPARLHSSRPFIPQVTGPIKPSEKVYPAALFEEYEWLHNVRDLYKKEQLTTEDFISWAAFHATRQPQVPQEVTIGAMLPMFYENAHSVAMVKHGMKVVSEAVQFLNPGQIPVMTVDQPLFALAKQIQWCWPESYGEDKFVIMLGGLHIEMAALRTLGTWLKGSGWVEVIVQSDIATTGTAESLEKASHVTKTRHSHQITAASLSILQQRAFHTYTEMMIEQEEEVMDFKAWTEMRKNQSPQFLFWHLTMEFQLLILSFVRAQREGKFSLYLETLTMLMPWFFALDSTHYGRWLPVHIRDMTMLAEVHPKICEQFQNGHFVLHKTSNVFSGMAIDQCHEQNNAIIKGTGGAVGLTENPSALRRWTVAGPELARLLTEFEQSIKTKNSKTHNHHEQVPSIQKQFRDKVNAMVNTFEEMGNPFNETDDLVTLDTKDIMDTAVVQSIKNVIDVGQTKYEVYIKERLESSLRPITDAIPRSNLRLFSKQKTINRSKAQLKVNKLQDNVALFSELYISCQTRSINMDDFFMHENQPYPPSLSEHGMIRLGKKSDLLDCLLEADLLKCTEAPAGEAKIIDGAAVVHFLEPKTACTFGEYAEQVFLPYIDRQRAHRVDIVWDRYFHESLKESARVKRGKGDRRRVLKTTKIPKKWNKFLLNQDNKRELFVFLTSYIRDKFQTKKEVYATCGENVICTQENADCTNIQPCNHEEADSRIFVHVRDAAQKGCKRLLIRTVDTDVVVLAIANFVKLEVDELWVEYGLGKHLRYIPVHIIALNLGVQKSQALPGFHSFTGCDTVSCFAGKGKKSAWDVWRVFPDVTQAFCDLSAPLSSISDDVYQLLERFVIILYDRTSSSISLDESRKELFTKRYRRKIESLPPTTAAFKQHVKRAAYQSGHVWGQTLVPEMQLPCPSEWGWSRTTHGWEPYWTTLPAAAKGCRELKKCSCKSLCSNRCSCAKALLVCTPMCNCVCEETLFM